MISRDKISSKIEDVIVKAGATIFGDPINNELPQYDPITQTLDYFYNLLKYGGKK